MLEKTLESPLDAKEIQPVSPKGNQCWIFIGRIDAEAEIPILCLLFCVQFYLLLLDLHTDFSRDNSWGHNKSDTTERPALSLSFSIPSTAAPSPNMFLFKLEIGSFVFVFCAHWQAKRNKFGLHTVQRRSDSLEKTLILGKIEGRRRRGWQRMRWLDGLTNSMDMSLSKLWWCTGRPDELQSVGSQRVRHNWVTELNWNVVHQAPLSMEFSRQDIGVGCHALLQGIFPTQESNQVSPHCRQSLYHLGHQGSLRLRLELSQSMTACLWDTHLISMSVCLSVKWILGQNSFKKSYIA